MSLFLDLLFPRVCYGCGRFGKYFCPRCLNKIPTKPIKITKLPFEGQLSLFRYTGLIKSAIHDLKYNFVTDLCGELASLSASRLKSNFPHLLQYWRENNFIFVSIPLHPSRQNWRGFNQSEILGQNIAKKLRIKFQDTLTRIKSTSSQTTFKNKSLRKANVSNIFKLISENIPQNLILFDDVSTTGSTLLSAASLFPPTSHLWTLTLAG